MRVRGYLLIAAVGLSQTGCGGPAPSPAPIDQASSGQAAAPGAATATSAEADRALVELKAAARLRLAADKAAVSNRLGYEQAKAKQRRDAEATGMESRIGHKPLDKQVLSDGLAERVRLVGARLVAVRIASPTQPKPLPEVWAGPGPYPWELDQYIGTQPLAIEVEGADEAQLVRLFDVLRRGEGPMLDLVAVRIQGERATFTGNVYFRREVVLPRHTAAAMELGALAEGARVDVPRGHPRMGEVEALVAEHRALLPELEKSLAVLAEVDLQGRVFQFYRQRAKDIAGRAFPVPIRDTEPAGVP